MHEDTEKIRNTRRKLKWSVQEMADALGIAKGTLNHYEQGRKIPRPIMLLLDTIIKENTGD